MARVRSAQGIAVLVAIVVAAAAIIVGAVSVWRVVSPPGDGTPAIPGIRSATELGPLRQNSRVNGRDDGQSTKYGNRSVWVFGDTVVRDPWGFISSTGASTSDLRASNGITITGGDVFGSAARDPANLLPLTPSEEQFTAAHATETGCNPVTDPYCGAKFGLWPGAVVADPARHRLLVLYSKLCRGGSPGTPCTGTLGRPIGTGIAAVDMNTRQVTRLTPLGGPAVRSIEGTDPTLFFPHATGYTAAALLVGNDLYVYGNCHSRCDLAKVPAAAVADRTRWRFFAGRTPGGAAQWTKDMTHAASTVSAGSAGNTVFWVPALKSWLNVYMPKLSNALIAQVGASPSGPWSAAFPLLTTNNAGSGTNYAGFGHPEYAEDDGLVQYLSYYQDSTYKIRMVKVVFKR